MQVLEIYDVARNLLYIGSIHFAIIHNILDEDGLGDLVKKRFKSN